MVGTFGQNLIHIYSVFVITTHFPDYNSSLFPNILCPWLISLFITKHKAEVIMSLSWLSECGLLLTFLINHIFLHCD